LALGGPRRLDGWADLLGDQTTGCRRR